MSVRLARASLLLAVGTALAVAACTTPGAGPTRVTRFHLGQPIAPGDIAVEPRPGADPQSLEFQAYAAPVAAELGHLGFHLAPGVAGSELVAVVDAKRFSHEGPPKPPPFSIGIGGASFGSHVGVGGGASFPIGHARRNEIVDSELGVQIKRRSDGTVIWEGRAMNEARGDALDSSPDATAARLAHALFAGFPGESGRTITVK